MKTEERSTKKLDIALAGEINNLKKPNILEFGVQIGSSTSRFIEICKKKMENYTPLISMIVLIYLIRNFGNLSNLVMMTIVILIKKFLQRLT